MKIDSLPTPGVASVAEARPRAQTATTKQAAAADVQISDLSARLQAIEGSATETAPVDSARVAEIKQAITDGRFTINSGAIADRLIGTAMELLQNKPSKA